MAEPYFKDARSAYTPVLPREAGGKDPNIFYRYSDVKLAGLPDTPSVSFENLKVEQSHSGGERGSSSFQLYLTINMVPGDNGKFQLTVTRAELDACIWVKPRHEFKPLADFKPMYDDYAANGKGAAKKYLVRHNGQTLPDGSKRGGHWSTSFDGIRAKTVRHELDHVAFAIKECEGYVHNFVNVGRDIGRTPSSDGWPALDRLEAHIDRFLGGNGFPYFDVGGEDHKNIAYRDFFFMVAWYEEFELGLAKKTDAGYDAFIAAITNYRLKGAMTQLGEEFPWLST